MYAFLTPHLPALFVHSNNRSKKKHERSDNEHNLYTFFFVIRTRHAM